MSLWTTVVILLEGGGSIRLTSNVSPWTYAMQGLIDKIQEELDNTYVPWVSISIVTRKDE